VCQFGLGQAELASALRHAIRDLGKEPAVFGVREPLANAFERLVCPVRSLTHISTTLYIAVMRYMIAVAVNIVTSALLLATGYELAVAFGVIGLGSLPGEGPPGEGVVAVVAALALLAAAFLAATLDGPRLAALLAPLAGAFLVAHFYTFDPYYLPTLIRHSERDFLPVYLVYSVAGLAIAAGVLTLVRRRAGLALSAPVILACGLAAWFAAAGH
jgi:hypothetical protein